MSRISTIITVAVFCMVATMWTTEVDACGYDAVKDRCNNNMGNPCPINFVCRRLAPNPNSPIDALRRGHSCICQGHGK